MKTRWIAAVAALLLAAVGTVLLLSYAHKAEARASGAPGATTSVLVMTAAVDKGATAEQVSKLVTTRNLPDSAVLPNRITDIAQLAGQVALVPLEAGEQLLTNKFGPAAAATTSQTSTSVRIPPNLHQLTISLEPQRVVGGILHPGDTVGIFLSKDDQTHLTLHKVLVINVQTVGALADPNGGGAPLTTDTTATTATSETTGATASTAPTSSGTAATTATSASADPSNTELITLAVTGAQGEKIVFAAEFGSIWLSKEPVGADENGTNVVNNGNWWK